jgi:hypothetical protein
MENCIKLLIKIDGGSIQLMIISEVHIYIYSLYRFYLTVLCTRRLDQRICLGHMQRTANLITRVTS